MWSLVNHTPFAGERTWVRDRDGAEVWIVALKATFTIHPDGTTSIAERQEPVCRVPKYRGEPGKSSLLYEGDLERTKACTDVLLHGHAYAPYGEPTAKTTVKLTIGDAQKTLLVHGDRRWEARVFGVGLSAPQPFEKMPLVYERAAGGADCRAADPKQHDWERRNPVGTGFATQSDHAIGQLAPNVEYPDEAVSRWGQRTRPAGFGPIARDWSPRAPFAGTYDDAWFNERRPLVPRDFDDCFFHTAPADQQFPYLRGGEVVELTNLTPSGRLRFQLPKLHLGFATRMHREWRHQRPLLHTVIIEPDAARLMMVYHAALPCHHEVYALRGSRLYQKKRLAGDGVDDFAGAGV